MSEVYVDGEKVVFEGEMPGKPAEIYDLLMTVLSEQGRAVTGFVSDGVNLLSGEQLPETFQRIEVSSLSHRELTLQVIREFLDKMGAIGDDLRSYSKNILTIGWSEVFRRMDEFIDKIKPLYDKILVERLPAESKTKGGIIIPDTAKEKPSEGNVLAVGEGSRDESGKITALTIKKGDKVLFAKWGGTEVNIGGKDLILVKESDILAIVQ